ncbi:hypothetical protein BC351_22440 [Paenibacillus ferrarius]|uniref:Uncharacterized protein n=1 Tax=Paenibacillus ferrarius TaxID=1469647 RepID=A0A1V4HN55_9BACL|nr:hypothetical protein [Paenibacillus ferrarius]OPH59087.1 hypothetical protein BC351_22440 [Paenibacillus ferrarius]
MDTELNTEFNTVITEVQSTVSFELAQLGFDRFWAFLEPEPAFLAGSAEICSFPTTETAFLAGSAQ